VAALAEGPEEALVVGLEVIGERLAGRLVGHHSDPKFLAGNPKQPLTMMEEASHIDLHRDLNNFLDNVKNSAGKSMGPKRGNSGADILGNFGRNASLNQVAAFYKQYGAKYATAARDFFAQHPGLR
jgi:hypothetical protein